MIPDKSPSPEKWKKWMDEYYRKFNDMPPFMYIRESKEALESVKKAIKNSKPNQIPKGIIV